jgi:penicillin-insensitive murein DD-endopeptidase
VNFSGLLGKSSPANRVTGTAEVPDISDGIASAPRTWQKGSACDVLRDAIFGIDHGATQADRRPMKIFVRLTLAICAWAAFLTASLGGNIAPDHERPSVCYGDSVSGRLEGGTRLSYSGENYRAYSMLGFALGRTYVHSTVRDIMREAYAELAKNHPDLKFIYGESGWAKGGRFHPHRGHSNGTAADFFVPIRSFDGRVSQLSISPFNLFGYATQFDRNGRSGSNTIDFEAMALHLLALDRAARAHGIGIRRVIFDVNLQPKLAGTGAGREVLRRLPFNKQQAWVRHDEHYHVDFRVACR